MTSEEYTKKVSDSAIEGILRVYEILGFGKDHLIFIKKVLAAKNYTYKQASDEFSKLIGFETPPEILKSSIDAVGVDIINRYNAFYRYLMTSGSNYEWFRFVGSNLTTSRAWCIAMTKKDYYHACEVDRIIKGDFEEFQSMGSSGVDLYDKRTKLPKGLSPETTPETLPILRGGDGCGHGIYSIPRSAVPCHIIEKVESSIEYKKWLKNKNIE